MFNKLTQSDTTKKIFHYVKYALLTFLVCIAIGAVIIKAKPSIAATIADDYLRPLIGTQTVTNIEEIFFNASDQTSQIIYEFKKPSAPIPNNITTNKIRSALNLTPIKSFFIEPLDNEGVWQNLKTTVAPDQEVLAYTFVRPDPDRAFSEVSLVQVDNTYLKVGAVAGIVEPGGSLGNHGSGFIPQEIIDSRNLVAAFNGGFLYVDGNYGMIVDNKTYVPLKNNLATFIGSTDGSLKIINYTGEDLGNDVSFARQNGPLLIENGVITLNSESYQEATARVLRGGTYTWRSGIGINKEGNLIYAAGNNLNPLTLAKALLMAGAINAMQLDINPSQVRFDLYNKNDSGLYDTIPLNQELAYLNKNNNYLHGYRRDYFYIYKK